MTASVAGAPEVQRWRGSASAFHGRELPDPLSPGRSIIWQFEVDRPAVVLGSRQTVEVLDLNRCRRDSVEVVERRSGGGLVLLVPDEVVWIDVVAPPDHPAAVDDIRASMIWMGERWCEAIAAVFPDLAPSLRVHRGGLVDTPWSDLVCFAGLGPGEVLFEDLKLLGLSQRRTRRGARFQGSVHLRTRPHQLLDYLIGPVPPFADLPPVAELPSRQDEPAGQVGRIGAALAEALAAALSHTG